MPNPTQRLINQLNSFLRVEMSAVHTYKQALKLLDDEPSLKKLLSTCLQSHEQRAESIRTQVLALGGAPAKHLNPKGAFIKLMERGAALWGLKAAMKALEEGEALGLNEYERQTGEDLPAELRELVESRLLPEQRHTHATLTQVTSRL